MIALDASAVVALALQEPEEEPFNRAIAFHKAMIGTPSLVETRIVLAGRDVDAETFIRGLLNRPSIHVVAFTLQMYEAAVLAFDRYGKGRGHPAQLNFGDCMAYAVAKVHNVPLLYKGNDFGLTDIRQAL